MIQVIKYTVILVILIWVLKASLIYYPVRNTKEKLLNVFVAYLIVLAALLFFRQLYLPFIGESSFFPHQKELLNFVFPLLGPGLFILYEELFMKRMEKWEGWKRKFSIFK